MKITGEKQANPVPNAEIGQFKPGQSGNPSGRPPEASTRLKNFTKQSIALAYSQIVDLEIEELKTIAKYPRTTAIKAIVASALVKAKETGDYSQLDKILERIIGKVHDEKDASSGNIFNITIFTESLNRALERAKCISLPS